MKDLLLSPHFKISEFERSATATSTGSTSPAEPTSARTAIKSSTSFRRSNVPPQEGAGFLALALALALCSLLIAHSHRHRS